MKATKYSREDAAKLIKAGILPNAPQAIIDAFLELCNTKNLNPYNKDAYIVSYYDREKGEAYAFITSYHVLIRTAQSCGDWAGLDAVTYNHRYNERGEIVKDTMASLVAENKAPLTAHATVWKVVAGNRYPFSYEINCREYIKTNKEGKPSGMYARMMFTMLEKCVIARAVRLTWPQETDRLSIEEELAAVMGNTDQVAGLESTDKSVAPKEVAKKENPLPMTAEQAAERAEALGLIQHELNNCITVAGLGDLWRANAKQWGADMEIIQIFGERKKDLLQAEAAKKEQDAKQ